MLNSFIIPLIVVLFSIFFSTNELNAFILSGVFLGNFLLLTSVIYNLLFNILKFNAQYWAAKVTGVFILLSFFVIFFSISGFSVYVLYVIFFHSDIIELRIRFCFILFTLFCIITLIKFFIRRLVQRQSVDLNEFIFNMLCSFLFSVFLFSIHYLISFYFPIKYLILLLLCEIKFSENINNFYKNRWTQIIRASSYFSIFLRFFSISPFSACYEVSVFLNVKELNDVFPVFPRFVNYINIPGAFAEMVVRPSARAVTVAVAPRTAIVPINRPLSTGANLPVNPSLWTGQVFPLTKFLHAGMRGDMEVYNGIRTAFNLDHLFVRHPYTGRLKAFELDKSCEPLHCLLAAQAALDNTPNLLIASTYSFSLNENVFVVESFDGVDIKKIADPVYIRASSGDWVLLTGACKIPIMVSVLEEEILAEIERLQILRTGARPAFVVNKTPCLRANTGDLIVSQADGEILKQIEFKTNSSGNHKQIETNLIIAAHDYKSLDLQYLDRQNQVLHYKQAGSADYITKNLHNIELDDKAISAVLVKSREFYSDPANYKTASELIAKNTLLNIYKNKEEL